MKTIFFKIVMQASAVLLAIGASLTTHSSERNVSTIIPGYITLNPANPCAVQVLCTSGLGPLCTAIISGINYQAFGKSLPSDTYCQIVRYRILD